MGPFLQTVFAYLRTHWIRVALSVSFIFNLVLLVQLWYWRPIGGIRYHPDFGGSVADCLTGAATVAALVFAGLQVRADLEARNEEVQRRREEESAERQRRYAESQDRALSLPLAASIHRYVIPDEEREVEPLLLRWLYS